VPIVQICVVQTFNNNDLIRLNQSESFTIISTTLIHLEINKSRSSQNQHDSLETESNTTIHY